MQSFLKRATAFLPKKYSSFWLSGDSAAIIKSSFDLRKLLLPLVSILSLIPHRGQGVHPQSCTLVISSSSSPTHWHGCLWFITGTIITAFGGRAEDPKKIINGITFEIKPERYYFLEMFLFVNLPHCRSLIIEV